MDYRTATCKSTLKRDGICLRFVTPAECELMMRMSSQHCNGILCNDSMRLMRTLCDAFKQVSRNVSCHDSHVSLALKTQCWSIFLQANEYGRSGTRITVPFYRSVDIVIGYAGR